MKNRKPTNYEAEEQAKKLTRNEIIIRKACLKTAKQKVLDLSKKIESGDTSKKVQKELAEQREIALGIKAWLKENDKTA